MECNKYSRWAVEPEFQRRDALRLLVFEKSLLEGGYFYVSGAINTNGIDFIDDEALVGYWIFNDAPGNQLIDSSTYGNNGTINGAAWSFDTPDDPVLGCTYGNALNYNGCVATAVAAGGDGTSCQTSHAAYLADDSGSIFTTDCLADGDPSDCAGKLWYDINALCIGVNEVIIFDATFDRVSQ